MVSFETHNDRPYEKTCPTPPVGVGVLEYGDEMARQGKRDDAIAWYEYLLTLDNTLGIDPQAREVAGGRSDTIISGIKESPVPFDTRRERLN